jgi:hypothetical protein
VIRVTGRGPVCEDQKAQESVGVNKTIYRDSEFAIL